jgi:PleD family two-component response regulator
VFSESLRTDSQRDRPQVDNCPEGQQDKPDLSQPVAYVLGALHTEFLTLTKIGRRNKFSDASWGGLKDSKGASLDKSPVRILEVDDSEPFRSLVSSLLQRKPELQVVSVASDGLSTRHQS